MINSEQRVQTLRAANILTKTVQDSTKSTIGVFGGDIDSIAFAVFGFSKFRLGTQQTRFQIADLLIHGRLPLGGALAYQLAATHEAGYAIARYLAISGRFLTAHDLFMLGLLTHIVEDECHFSLADTLGHALPPDDDVKAVQAHAVDESSIPDLLDTMHVYTSDKDSDTMDVLSHPMWDKMMLVKPQPIPLESFFLDEEAKAREEDFEDVMDEVIRCFSSDDPATCKQLR